MTLTLAATERPLPHLWDGRKVLWRENPVAGIFLCNIDDDEPDPLPEHCTECAVVATPRRWVGIVHPHPGEKGPRQRYTKSGHGILTYQARLTPELRLHLTRCPECGHDTVLDSVTREVWDLDDTDYGPEGSWPAGEQP